ncbi:MAG: GRP family sugar transporter [Candidatus Buchananbacteria bacterium]
MLWMFVIAIAYFLNASAVTIDKFLLSKKMQNPAVYSFFISVLSLLGVVLIPFGFHFVSLEQTLIAFGTGIVFTFAYLFMFYALNGNEATRITPFMGGLQPIFVFFLAWIFLGEFLSPMAIIAFVVIVIGTIIISRQHDKNKKQQSISRKSYIYAIISTLLFAIAYTLTKYVYIEDGFITGFVLTRIGTAIGALLLLIPPKNLKDIINEIKKPKQKTGGLFLVGQGAGALSFILVSYAIAISSSVAIVNASRGLEYVFLLLIIGALSIKYPKLLKEKMSRAIIWRKTIATMCIIIGLVLLAFS